ncbi:MAG: hypothetical protein KA896_04810, partial [Leptothrix sp. (in: Bacteria)]|nr:hypothetical protein [Leptothrix sp. (in: b-proteobacteria)]
MHQPNGAWSRRRWLKTGVLMWGFGRLARADETLRPPVLSLARPMPPGLHPEGWLVSEKYDGVRAHWDGQQLRSRSGHRIALPQVLLAQLPSGQPLDGELWLGRGQFQSLMSLLQTADAAAPGWQHLRYMVFDWPGGPGRFDERIAALRARLHAPGEGPGPVEVVEQLSFETRVELRRHFQSMVAAGAEGLVLHRADAPWEAGRSDHLLKWKPVQDAEAVLTTAFVPLKFELGDAFQFDWSEEGLVVGGIYYRVQVAHL